MPSVLNVLTESWEIIRKQPTVLIPYTVIAILMVVVIGAAGVVLLLPSLIGTILGGSAPSASSIVNAILWPLVATIGVAAIVGFFVGAILNGVYLNLAAQARAGKKIAVDQAFRNTRKVYLRLLEVQLIILVIEAIIGVIVFSPIAYALLSGAFKAGAAGYTLLSVVGALILFFVSMFLFLPSVLVVIEKKPAIVAVKKSYHLVKNNFWTVLKLYAALVAIGIIYSIATSIVNAIPIAGQIVTFVAAIIYATWNLMIPAIFYLDFMKGKGKR